MKVVLLSGSNVGSKTRITMNHAKKSWQEKYPDHDVSLIDLKEYNVEFSDGRNFLDYTGDTAFVIQTIMAADILLIGSPVFQASIPASLKNIFDLLPQNAFREKTVAIFMTAGSPKHFLVAEYQLKPILSYMKANIVPSIVFVDEVDFFKSEINNDDTLMRIETLVSDTFVFAQSYQEFLKNREESFDF